MKCPSEREATVMPSLRATKTELKIVFLVDCVFHHRNRIIMARSLHEGAKDNTIFGFPDGDRRTPANKPKKWQGFLNYLVVYLGLQTDTRLLIVI
jgi:hypothetical protein